MVHQIGSVTSLNRKKKVLPPQVNKMVVEVIKKMEHRQSADVRDNPLIAHRGSLPCTVVVLLLNLCKALYMRPVNLPHYPLRLPLDGFHCDSSSSAQALIIRAEVV